MRLIRKARIAHYEQAKIVLFQRLARGLRKWMTISAMLTLPKEMAGAAGFELKLTNNISD